MRLGYRARFRGWDSGLAVACRARIGGRKATKRVESFRVPCLDAGSSPATSTREKDDKFDLSGSSSFLFSYVKERGVVPLQRYDIRTAVRFYFRYTKLRGYRPERQRDMTAVQKNVAQTALFLPENP